MFAARARNALLVAALAALAGCGQQAEDPEAGPPLPWESAAFPAPSDPADNPASDAKRELGRMLFYDPLLSRDGKVACATCHSELWGLGDGLALSVGIDGTGPTGPGRDGPNKTPRNALTLWNAAYRSELFWDGRAGTLEEQALMPIRSEVELARDLDELVADVRAVDGYRALFAAAFDGDEPVTVENLARALAVLERGFVSDWAPYDRYAAGDHGALSGRAVEGMFLFAEVGCAGCHAPPLFESMAFTDRGIGDDDVGRFEVTGDEADRHAFRVPTLRNLRETGPYFHDGSVATLEEAVTLEASAQASAGSRSLAAQDIAAVAEFIRKGLMDRSREPARPDAVPSGLEVPPDGFRIPR